jgi:hypothetical protein
MQPTEYGQTHNFSVGMVEQRRGTWDALVDALMRASLIEIGDVFGHDMPQMALTR